MDVLQVLQEMKSRGNGFHETAKNEAGVAGEPNHELAQEVTSAITNQFNNIMMQISSYAELELKKAAPAQTKKLENILRGTSSATLLLQKLVTQVERPEAHSEPVCINDLAKRAKEFVGAIWVGTAELDLDLAPSPMMIQADSSEIERAIVGLLLHARQRAGVDDFTIRTTTIEPFSRRHELRSIGFDQKWVILSIEQSVPSKRTLNREAESTDPILVSIRRVLQQFNGELILSSRLDGSLEYEVSFPASGKTKSLVTREEEGVPQSPSSQTVLIVDDDAAIRNAAAEFLKIGGFKVLQAPNGSEALALVEKGGFKLDLLVTDIVMTGLDGIQLSHELLRNNPGLRVLYVSGDSGKSQGVEPGPRKQIMQKPFRLDVMNQKIKDMLRN